MITFDKSTHTYMIDGVRAPSVTQILQFLNPNKYENIPPEILAEKAEYGNRVHEWIEHYALTGKKKRQTEMMKLSTLQAVDLLSEFKAEQCEEVVTYKGVFCGTYDMYGTIDGKKTLIDIKTTAEFDEPYLSWQLGMYKIALEAQGERVDRCMCLWLPKGAVAYLLDVKPKDQYEIDWLLFRYEQEHNSGQ